jgi:hypothetical protein
MFKSLPDAVPPVVVSSDGLVPLSILALDLDAPPVDGWEHFLGGRGIPVLADDIGRRAVSSDDARQLLDEKREAEVRRREVIKRNEQRAVELDRLHRSQIWQGVPADHLPAGATPASVMLAAAKDSLPRRQTPLQHALSNTGELTYHPLPQDGE